MPAVFRIQIVGHQAAVNGGTAVGLTGRDSIHGSSPAGSDVATTTPVGVVVLSMSRPCTDDRLCGRSYFTVTAILAVGAE